MLPFLELDPTIVKDMITVNITAATYLCHQVINCNYNDDLDYVVFSFYLRWYQRGRVLSSTLPPSVPLLQLIIECACTWDIALKEVLPELHFSQVATCPDRTLQSMLLPSTTCTLSQRCKYPDLSEISACRLLETFGPPTLRTFFKIKALPY